MALYPDWSDPFTGLHRLNQDLRRMQEEMNRMAGGYRRQPTGEFPPISVWRGEDGLVVTAEMPGVGIDDIDITVHQNTLTIKGRVEPEASEPDVTFHRQERSYGSFARTVMLPFNVDADKVEAGAQNGIVTIHLPRPETEKPRRIAIKAS